MLFPRIPSRPVRYAIIATYSLSDAISKLISRLEQYEAETIEHECSTTIEHDAEEEATPSPTKGRAKPRKPARSKKGG